MKLPFLRPISEFAASLQIPFRQKAEFSRSFALLLGARIPLLEALRVASRPFEGKPLGRVLIQIRRNVSRGETHGDSFALFPKVFDLLAVQLISIGEVTGNLGLMLNQIAEHQQKSIELRRKVVSAISYPAVISVISFLAVFFMLVTLVPLFGEMYADSGNGLPAPTQWLLEISALLSSRGEWFLLFFLVPGIVAWQFRFEPRFRLWRARVMRHIPLFGRIILDTQTTEFCRTLGTLLVSGVPLVDSLNLVVRSSRSMLFSAAAQNMNRAVEGGKSLADFRDEYLVIPFLVRQMIRIGEETGQTGNMLLDLGSYYEKRVLHTVETTTSLLEPLLILLIGGVVGFILVAMYLPMLDMVNAVG